MELDATVIGERPIHFAAMHQEESCLKTLVRFILSCFSIHNFILVICYKKHYNHKVNTNQVPIMFCIKLGPYSQHLIFFWPSKLDCLSVASLSSPV